MDTYTVKINTVHKETKIKIPYIGKGVTIEGAIINAQVGAWCAQTEPEFFTNSFKWVKDNKGKIITKIISATVTNQNEKYEEEWDNTSLLV